MKSIKFLRNITLLSVCGLWYAAFAAYGDNTEQNDRQNTNVVQWAAKVVKVSSQLKRGGSYSSWQLLGKPNILSRAGDTNPCSWAADHKSDGRDTTLDKSIKATLRVGFAQPMIAQQAVVAENLNPGAVSKITLFGVEGQSLVVYTAEPKRIDQRWRMLNVFFDPTPFKVNQAEIEVATGAVLGWNEIDAIGIGSSRDTIKPEINVAPSALTGLVPENLGERINTIHDESIPLITPDGKSLFFSRKGDPKNLSGPSSADIWYAELGPDGFWGQAQNIGKPLNNKSWNFVSTILPDGNTLMLGNVYEGGDRMRAGVSLSYRTREGWSFPVKQNIKMYSNAGNYVSYCLSPGGKELLIAHEPEIGYGGMDIFVSFLQGNGVWSEPLNIGKGVNTGGNEMSVFLASDSRTLYFSSEGHNGYGAQDIFVTTRLDSTWERWSEPQNLGPSINTEGFDAFFSIPASGDFAYFVSKKNTFGKGDLFRIPLPEALKPSPVVLISGVVIDAATGAPLEAQIHYERLSDGREMGSARSNPIDGRYTISLPAGELYGYRAEASNYIGINNNIDVRALAEYREVTADLKLAPLQKGQTARINNLFFAFGEAALQPESFSELERLAALMQSNANMKITIIGHTDNVGSPADNKSLSLRRAQAVVQHLTKQGVEGTRIAVVGKGETKPIASNDNEEGRRQNRRVELRIDDL